MPIDALVTATVLVVTLAALIRERVSPAAGTLGALVVLTLAGVLEPAEAFLGFSNPATLTVAGLFVVARALQEHGGLADGLARLLGSGRRERVALAKLVGPTVAVSGVTNNTPLVAALAPLVRDWAERHGRAPSRFLMPVSFAAILGGVITTIGTSATLVVSGLVDRSTGTPFGLLEVTPVGLPVAVVGGGLLVLLAPRVLPDRRTMQEQVLGHEREYTLPLRVVPGGPIDGADVTEAGLRNLASVYLAAVQRGDREVAPVGPHERLQGDDVLVFVGSVEQVSTLQDRDGLTHTDLGQLELLDGDGHDRFEAVVGRNGPLVGRTLKGVSFRGRYGAAVLAIHRAGQRVDHKLGTVPLEPGDSLLVHADPGFADRWRGRSDFAVVAPLDDRPPAGTSRRWLVLATVVAMVLAAAVGVVPIVTAVLAACAVLLATRTLTFLTAKDSLDVDVLIVIAASIGLGTAVAASGLASSLADGVLAVAPGGPGGRIAALLLVVVATVVLTELITNVASAALMVPVALDVAAQVGGDPRGFAVAVAIAASASFLTPLGYQTNTMVYGLGGYRFGDYWRLGLPLSLTTVAVTTTAVLVVWG